MTGTDRSSASFPSTSQPSKNLDHHRPTNPRRNHRSGSRSRRNSNPRYEVKSEVKFSESDASDCLGDELSSLKLQQSSNSDSVIDKNPSGNSSTEEKFHLSSGENLNCEESAARRDETEEVAEDIMLTILKDLRSSVSEPELTEEQLRTNDQLQEDELLALGYIYGGNMFILERHKDMRYFQIHVNVEATSEYTVSAKLNLQADSSKESEDFLYSFKAQYLPPIVLTCLLPNAYPSHLPPYFILSVQWMNPDKISSLCSMLNSIWMEQPGQEVLYQWTDWLQNSSMSHLGFDNEIVLGPYGVACSRDKRAVSGSRSPDADIPYIKSYDEEKRHESFLKSLHECCICFSESAGFDFVKLPCQHIFCKKCLKTYADIHVFEGTVNKLQCPDSKCGEIVPPGILKILLGDEAYERWETLMLQKTLETMKDVAYCPRCETPCIEDEEQLALCFKCYFSFCTLCKEKRHVGVTCMSPELKLQILEGRQSSSRLGEEQRRKEKEMINELISVSLIKQSSKQCPSCKMAISRTGGCNKMVCNNCGQYFCYRCCKAITGYEHFSEGSCNLFPQDAIQEFNDMMMMNERQVIGQIQAQLFAEYGQFLQRGQLCPNCRQFNAKMGNNNHLFCWACQAHFCYLCKKVVKRCGQHYGPKGCKQHTDG
ncbi:hypothetical protein EUTSA_v10007022mg [Eutrema salsugineum]|uniref:RBR-type E3 ubiquitin transferase n=1 Tax=Eutrema salsugineum TaxID=72664 RepID=V4KQM2_EUTSA|nr:E3 ubiquitin-protein ligase RNF14 [Eutrema salsugineum]ESQ33569.1 hypothetical protein EUTSA_v10007022mg [Eutrema salsugineum]